MLPRHSLNTIYKSFVRPHLDFGDIVYDQPNNDRFCQNIESMHYNVSLAILGALKGTFWTKLYEKLGLETRKFRWWFRRLCSLSKIKTTGLPKYLFKLIPPENHSHNVQWHLCQHIVVELIPSNIHFSLTQFVNGTSLTSILVVQNHYYLLGILC